MKKHTKNSDTPENTGKLGEQLSKLKMEYNKEIKTGTFNIWGLNEPGKREQV